MICTRCSGTGFLNLEQVDAEVLAQYEAAGDPDLIRDWIADRNSEIERLDCACHISPPCGKCELYHDVQVCDCCGDGDGWYGEPGNHGSWIDSMEPFPECF